MNAKELIDELKGQGITLQWDGGSLYWDAPFEYAPSDEIIKLAEKNKDEIVRRINGPVPEELFSGSNIAKLIGGDCLGAMKRYPDNLVDVIVTDPPYGLEFMKKDWDKDSPSVEIWKECLRVLKPGGFAYIMSSSRQDILARMIVNLEEAGFRTEISSLYWTYATGVPKAHNVGKIIEKRQHNQNVQDFVRFDKKKPPLGEDKSGRIVIKWTKGSAIPPEDQKNSTDGISRGANGVKSVTCWVPTYESENSFSGAYASYQPKPAVEVIIIVQKPLSEPTYVDQALFNNKGCTWLGDCGIPDTDINDLQAGADVRRRFSPNLLCSDNVLGDDYSRYFSLDAWVHQQMVEGLNISGLEEVIQNVLPFMIVPKPLPTEKNWGCENLPPQQVDKSRKDPNAAVCNNPRNRGGKQKKNFHPTVKPILLMTYLITMGSREGEIVLDPFCGSGTTCLAARLRKRPCIGIEKNPEYFKIAAARMRALNLLSHTGQEQQITSGTKNKKG